MRKQEKIMTYSNLILLMTATCSALMAGLFYAYSCSVVLGLRLLPDAGYLSGMEAINKAIQNPVFFVVFMGILLLLPYNTYLHYTRPLPARFWLFLTATIVYFCGVFFVTAFGNIPLNNALEKFNILQASGEAVSLQRTNFEARWNNLNMVRTISSLLSLVLVIMGCIYPGSNHAPD